MRHVLIVNPTAGKNQMALKKQKEFERYAAEHGLVCTVLVTQKSGDATQFAREWSEKGEAVRIYVCGGDGTLCETVNGMSDNPLAELVLIPCGSGNDFLRYFDNKDRFSDVDAVVNGTACPIDAIAANGEMALNLCSMGMDADVAMRMKRYKRWPLISGSAAYNLAVANMFFHRLGRRLRVVLHTSEGLVEQTGDFLFALAANGRYYGGGYCGAPLSVLNDGLLDFVLVDKVGHFKVLGFLKRFRAGKHLGMKICHFYRGTKMEVFADQPLAVNADGECEMAPQATFEILPNRIRFVLPSGVTLPKIRKEENTTAAVM